MLVKASTVTSLPEGALIEPTAENGLRLPTQAMIDHIQSVRVERVQLVIGRIATADLRAISRAVATYLGFTEVPERRAEID